MPVCFGVFPTRANGIMKSRTYVSIVLVAALFISFISIPHADSQAAVTTTKTTITQPPSGQCAYIVIPFTAKKGFGIDGKFGSDASVSFYVVTGDDLKSLQNPACQLPTTAKPLFSETNVQGHDNPYGTLAFPADGTYYFVVVYANTGNVPLESGHVTVELTYPSSITLTQSQTSTSASPSTSYSTATISATSILVVSQTVTSTEGVTSTMTTTVQTTKATSIWTETSTQTTMSTSTIVLLGNQIAEATLAFLTLGVAASIVIFVMRAKWKQSRVCGHCGFTNPRFVESFCVRCGKPLTRGT